MSNEILESTRPAAVVDQSESESVAEAAPETKRGFAALDPDARRAVARKGGRAAHAQGRAHQFDADQAREAGRKGGEAVSRDRAHMSAIGRAGGLARGRKRAAEKSSEAPRASSSVDSGQGESEAHA